MWCRSWGERRLEIYRQCACAAAAIPGSRCVTTGWRVAACVWLKWGLSDRPLERRWRTLARRHPPLHRDTHTHTHTLPLRHGLGEERCCLPLHGDLAQQVCGRCVARGCVGHAGQQVGREGSWDGEAGQRRDGAGAFGTRNLKRPPAGSRAGGRWRDVASSCARH